MKPAEKRENPRGIPSAPFFEDNEISVKTIDQVDQILVELQDQYKKYQFMERNMQRKQEALNSKIPDIRKSLEALGELSRKYEGKDSLETNFELISGSLFAHATVPPTDKVGLWLGSNVMVEFTVGEARALLEKNISVAEANVKTIDGDLEFIKEQLTTMEVNIARVYNRGVKVRKTEVKSS